MSYLRIIQALGELLMMDEQKKFVKCCRNCRNLISIPKDNRFNDVDHYCMVSTYFTHGIDKDITKIKRYTPGGKELECRWESAEK